ncbi:mercury methylation ferredoxin HgcB [Candidatus Margulisiibacteriota bacterium]
MSKGQEYLTDVVTLKLDEAKCNGCGMCKAVCPHAVFEIKGRKAKITDRNACMECGACALNCPEEAIKVEAGVGCAAGIIQGLIKGTEPTCDCHTEGKSCCG